MATPYNHQQIANDIRGWKPTQFLSQCVWVVLGQDKRINERQIHVADPQLTDHVKVSDKLIAQPEQKARELL